MGLTLSEQITRVRRFLRDPDGAIFSDTMLTRWLNQGSKSFEVAAGRLEAATVVRLPALFAQCYQHTWEYGYSDTSHGIVLQVMQYDDRNMLAYCFAWEPESVSGTNASSNALGARMTQQWEAVYSGTACEPQVFWLPDNFHNALFFAYDEEVLEATDMREIQGTDSTWKTRTGLPFAFYRIDTERNLFALYPSPSSFTWSDPTWDAAADDANGAWLYTDTNTGSNSGVVVSATGKAIASSTIGTGIDLGDQDGQAFVVYRAVARDMADGTDESEFPQFLRKYIEQDALEQAYTANTDGKIESLRKYWAMRKEYGLTLVKAFNYRRNADRNYQLMPQGQPARSGKPLPRLPAEYPEVYP